MLFFSAANYERFHQHIVCIYASKNILFSLWIIVQSNFWDTYMYKKMFLDQKRYKKHCIFLKVPFQIPFFITAKFHEQKTAVNLSKYDLHVCP